MIFKVHECGSTRITSENKSDEKLLWKLYERIPKSQRGNRPNYWLFCRNEQGYMTLSITVEKVLQNYIKENLLQRR